MSDFNHREWFKKQYLEEGMSDEEIHAIRRYEELTDDDKLKLAKIQAMMDREREDQSKSSSLIGRMGDRSLREDDLNESMIEAQFEDLYQVVRNIHHVGGYDSIEEAAFEALQRIGEEFGVNFEEGRF
jgi:hypothetical protein